MIGSNAVKTDTPPEPDNAGSYQELRSLLLGSEYENILKERLKQDDIDRIAENLTEAFEKRNQNDNSLIEKLSPMIESSIDLSIRNSRSKFADIIYPIIGPAVRKSVANALTEMVHSLNHLLKQGFSAQAIVWRYKAWRLGMPYGQYAFIQNIQYRVEQVFLIHRETGLLLTSCSAENIPVKDPELISAMLTAITDFIGDSFEQESQSETLNAIQVGEFNLLIESGPYAAVAFAIRGSVHQDINERIQELCEQIHSQFYQELRSFSGNENELEEARPFLEDALIEKQKESTSSSPWFAIALLATISIYGVMSYYQSSVTNQKAERIIEEFSKAPGYQVLNYKLESNDLFINVLKTPEAKPSKDFESIKNIRGINLTIKETNLPRLEPNIFLSFLSEKYGIDFDTSKEQSGYELIAKGELSKRKIQQLEEDPIVKSIFTNINESQLTVAQEKVLTVDYGQNFLNLVNKVHQSQIYFDVGTQQIAQESSETISELASNLKELQKLEQLSPYSISQITVMGLADKNGTDEANLKLSRDRASLVAEMLEANGIRSEIIVIWALGDRDLPSVSLEHQRRVNIQVLFHDKPELL
ncbi:OmpA family protein [Aliikangiella sp. G2MR2-5]|uniref:OmpA family protein n=1 Tax=Aliikangiella sp. G2MR2-5 TaxID=2788943 RepID=UPI0018A9FCFF|nr:OmpA family protein [Aliikangiella sp. G2MR2-5]